MISILYYDYQNTAAPPPRVKRILDDDQRTRMIIKRLLMITIAALGMMIIILYYRHVVICPTSQCQSDLALSCWSSLSDDVQSIRRMTVKHKGITGLLWWSAYYEQVDYQTTLRWPLCTFQGIQDARPELLFLGPPLLVLGPPLLFLGPLLLVVKMGIAIRKKKTNNLQIVWV